MIEPMKVNEALMRWEDFNRYRDEAPMTAWKLFEIECPDGRVIRHRHASLEEASKALQDGYKVCGEVLGASTDDKGGLVMPIGPGTTSVMQTLLEAHGDELIAWLRGKGFMEL